MHTGADPVDPIQRLQQAINQHDLDALAVCFDPDYQSDFPAHPDRAFRGREQVRQNWTQILGAVPDLHAELKGSVVDGETVWCEWDWQGTRRDGVPFGMRGTTLQGVRDGMIVWSRLYMEPVETGDTGIATTVGHSSGTSGTEPSTNPTRQHGTQGDRS